MKKNLFVIEFIGLTFTAVLGTILHFLYEWTGLKGLAVISAVNESTWEHMKLVFVPYFIFAVAQSFFNKDYNNFWFIKLIGILTSTISIPILFYTLTGSFGTLSAVVNIIIFFVSVFNGYFLEIYLFNKIKGKKWLEWISVAVIIAIFILFIIFTFYPPKIPLFLHPVTKGYVITK